MVINLPSHMTYLDKSNNKFIWIVRNTTLLVLSYVMCNYFSISLLATSFSFETPKPR